MKTALKDIDQNFTSNKFNEKKSEHTFVKKINFGTFDALTDFFS